MQVSQIAINSISTRHADLEEALKAYAAAGFRNVEFHLPLIKDWLAEGHTLEDVSSLLKHYQLQSIGGFQSHVECFAAPESQRANHALHVENARLIHALGGGTLVVGTDGPEQPTIEALETVAQTLQQLAIQVKGLNVQIALEFNWSPLIKSLSSAVRVAELVDHPQVGVLFDPAHYYTTVTKFEHLTTDAIRWIKHVHIDDMRDKPGDLSNCNSDRVLPGEGIIDLHALVDRLAQGGYTGFYSIEMFNEELWRLPAAEAAQRCYTSMRSLCKEETA